MVNSFTPELSKALIDAKDYRAFLRGFSMTSSEMARRCGFKSRGYPADVIEGRRRITSASLPQFVRGLKLKADFKQLFVLLVCLEESDVSPIGFSPANARKKLDQVRNRLLARVSASEDPSRVSGFFNRPNWVEVYAAMGTLEQGAALDEIERRTGFSRKTCRLALSEMIRENVAREDSVKGRFYPINPHQIFEKLGGSPGFQKYYLSSLSQFSRKASSSEFDQEDRLFFTSAFSIDPKRAPEFKREFRELVLRFIDSAESPMGETVAKIVVGFVPDGCG